MAVVKVDEVVSRLMRKDCGQSLKVWNNKWLPCERPLMVYVLRLALSDRHMNSSLLGNMGEAITFCELDRIGCNTPEVPKFSRSHHSGQVFKVSIQMLKFPLQTFCFPAGRGILAFRRRARELTSHVIESALRS